MDFLFNAHSGLRYLVLLVGVVALLYFLVGALRRRRFERPASTVFGVLLGVIDLNALMGLILFITGRTPPGIAGHLTLMFAAAVVLHVASVVRRRQPQPTGFGLPLLGTTAALALITLGILSIGRSVI